MENGLRGDIPLDSSANLSGFSPLCSPLPLLFSNTGHCALSTFPSAASSQTHSAWPHPCLCWVQAAYLLLTPCPTSSSLVWFYCSFLLTSLFFFPCLLPSGGFLPPFFKILFPLSLPLLLLLNPFLSIPDNFPVFFHRSLIVPGSHFFLNFLYISLSLVVSIYLV